MLYDRRRNIGVVFLQDDLVLAVIEAAQGKCVRRIGRSDQYVIGNIVAVIVTAPTIIKADRRIGAVFGGPAKVILSGRAVDRLPVADSGIGRIRCLSAIDRIISGIAGYRIVPRISDQCVIPGVSSNRIVVLRAG